jgi:hypothetical protein
MIRKFYNSRVYRKQADEARQNAAKAQTEEHREGCLKLAEDFDMLAEAAEEDAATQQLVRSLGNA